MRIDLIQAQSVSFGSKSRKFAKIVKKRVRNSNVVKYKRPKNNDIGRILDILFDTTSYKYRRF